VSYCKKHKSHMDEDWVCGWCSNEDEEDRDLLLARIAELDAEVARLRSDVEKLDGILAGHEIGTAFFVDKGLPPLPAPNSAMTAESIVACVQHGIARSGK